MKNQQGIQGARRLLLIQFGITIFIASMLLMLSLHAAWSALLGGMVSLLPNLYFAKKLFKHHGAKAAKRIVSDFYKGEALKIALSVILFALVFIIFNVIPSVFFAVYITVQMVFWFAPLIFHK